MKNKRIAKGSFILSVIFCVTILSGCNGEPERPEWVTVEHEQYDFSIEYPTKWIVDLFGDTGRKGIDDEKLVIQRPSSIFGPPSSPTTFIIIVEWRAFHNPTLQDALNWGNETSDQNPLHESVQIMQGYEEFLLQEEYLSGRPAIRRRYTYFNLGGVLREEIYIPRKQDMITISMYVSEEYFDDFYPDFERIANSFQTISDKVIED